jgi:hypothetical protein
MTISVVVLPNGRGVTLGAYARAWRELLAADPKREMRGFERFAMPAGEILARLRGGLMDRINRHDRTMRSASDRRIFAKVKAAGARGAIRYECRWCGAPLEAAAVNPNNRDSRFCGQECRSSYA